MNDTDTRARDAERITYIDNHLLPMLSRDKEAFVRLMRQMLKKAAEDIFGIESRAVAHLMKAHNPSEPDDFYSLIQHEANPRRINKSASAEIFRTLKHDLRILEDPDPLYFDSEFVFGFWGALEAAGMSHEDIGRYFEQFHCLE